MTWREQYWQDAVDDPGYYAEVTGETLLDGDRGTDLFSKWCKEHHPEAVEVARAVRFLILLRHFPDDPRQVVEHLDRISRPWEDHTSVATLAELRAAFPEAGLPERVYGDDDLLALTDALLRDPELYRRFEEILPEIAGQVLLNSGLAEEFIRSCHDLAAEVRSYAEAEQEEHPYQEPYPGEPMPAEPAPLGLTDRTYQLSVAFSMLPEANSSLSDWLTWDQTRAVLQEWRVDVAEVTELLEAAIGANQGIETDRYDIMVSSDSVYLEVRVDSAVHAHNSGIIATLDREGAYTHYVQFKDLVMFYADEADMDTQLYGVLKTFGDRWADDGRADNYVMRHGRGSSAYLVLYPVKVSHQESVAAEVRRCARGMRVEILPPQPART